MQTLGLSDSTPRSEGRLKTLLWPTIRNATDLEDVTGQGFWVCWAIGGITLGFSLVAGGVQIVVGVFQALFFCLGGIGVRQRSRFAAVVLFVSYLADYLILLSMAGPHFSNQLFFNGSSGGVLRIFILTLLLANVRGTWLAARWPQSEAEATIPRLSATLWDKLSDQMPRVVWPRVRYFFYLLAGLELLLLLLALVGVIASRIKAS